MHALDRLPGAAALDATFDVERLTADLEQLRHETWGRQRSFSSAGVTSAARLDWRILSLRSIGGDGERTDPGGPSLTGYEFTDWLNKAPYVAQLLHALPARLRSVRMMALGPGARSLRHTDLKCGLAWGTLRLHIPVVTNPEATLVIEEASHQWQPGTFWYGDFSRPHRVSNTGTQTRVHLVIDAAPSPALLALFPPAFRDPQVTRHILFDRAAVPVPEPERDRLRCRFAVPAPFLDWESPESALVTAAPDTEVAIDIRDGDVVLTAGGQPRFGLVHLGDLEFRLAGWTRERTLQVVGRRVVLRTRVGATVHERDAHRVER